MLAYKVLAPIKQKSMLTSVAVLIKCQTTATIKH